MTTPVLLSAPSARWPTWLNQIARTLNLALTGKINASRQITLSASTTSTTVIDSRIGNTSFVGLTAMTLHAAAALASGQLFVVPSAGLMVITHPSNAATDQTFLAVIIG